MRNKGAWSEVEYTSREAAVKSEGRGSATFVAEQRVRQGQEMDPLVDPKGLEKYGPVRGSNNLLVPEGKQFVLKFGVAMPVQTDCDLTGSMGNNVNIFFKVQPKVQNLLVQGKNAVLKRYQTQMCTGAVQDLVDLYPYQRAQFEPDNEVERQMGLLYPQKAGGDEIEDYQIGLFAAAYLTDASIVKYGLRGYYYAVGDIFGRDVLDPNGRLMRKVFGDKLEAVLKVTGLDEKRLCTLKTPDIGKKLLEGWHGFFLQVNTNRYATEWWSEVLGRDRVILLPKTEHLAQVQAVTIGLTEGVLDLQSAVDYLVENKESKDEAKRIVEACSGIPIGLQTTFPNFGKIPMAGAKFASREDIWPVSNKTKKPMPAAGKKPAAGNGKTPGWKV